MAANKISGVRAAMCYDQATAVNSREHNNANVLTLGAGLIGPALAQLIVKTWLATEFGEQSVPVSDHAELAQGEGDEDADDVELDELGDLGERCNWAEPQPASRSPRCSVRRAAYWSMPTMSSASNSSGIVPSPMPVTMAAMVSLCLTKYSALIGS